MKETIQLIDSIPIIISYVAFGSVFLFTFNFITYKDRQVEIKNYLISCVTASFVIRIILNQLFKTIPENSKKYFLIGCVFSAVTAYIGGIICNSKRFNRVIQLLGIYRTTNNVIWKDVIEPYTWLFMHINGEDYGYLGEVKYVKKKTSTPKVVLKNYSKVNIKTGKDIVDYCDDKNRTILIDSKNTDIVEIIYTGDKSPTKEAIRRLKQSVVAFLKK